MESKTDIIDNFVIYTCRVLLVSVFSLVVSTMLLILNCIMFFLEELHRARNTKKLRFLEHNLRKLVLMLVRMIHVAAVFLSTNDMFNISAA